MRRAWPSFSVTYLFSLLFSVVAGCAPLPEVVTEPVGDIAPEAVPEPEQGPAPLKSPTPALPPGPPSIPLILPPLPDFAAEPALPIFAPQDAPPITGQFRREQMPERHQRDIRVGISTDRKSHKISCGEFCRAFLGGDQAGRVSGNLSAEIQGGRLVLHSDDDRNYSSSNTVTKIEAWDAGHTISVNGKNYRGRMELSIVNGCIRVVNELPVEEYLRGVVPNEIGHLDTSMFEALKAQAVAARTYAYKHFLSRSSQGFDVYADIRDQVYDGSAGESALANQAIDGSMGVVMQSNTQLVEAYYHSTCGGHTESVETWNRAPINYLQAVPDLDAQGNPWCALSSYSTWNFHYTWNEFTQIAKKNLQSAAPDKVFEFNRIEKALVLDRNPGHRVSSVLFVTDKGTFVVKGDKTRWLFRNPQNPEKTLPSAWFDIEQDSLGLTVKGRGFGHGIGLCQMGARGLAKAGYGYKEILWHYYPNVDLVKW